jgi:putative copper resistance protein D
LPRLAVVAWTIAVAGVVGVAVAVWHYLSTSPSGHSMHDAADAITRAGGRTNPLQPLFGSALLTAWQLDALAVVFVVLLGAWYLTGVALVPVRNPGARWPVTRTLWFAAGLLVVIFATCGSIAVYDQVLFSAHMAGHLALVMLGPALLMGGRPLTLALEASRPATRARIERALHGRVLGLVTSPPVALATYTGVIVISHLTGLMDTIMRSTWAGQLEHLVYLLVGCQFFVLVIGDEPLRWKLTSPPRWLLLSVAMAVDTFTGIVLLQGNGSIALAPSRLNVDALSDTHTGGAIMWFGGDAIMAVIMISLVIAWLRTADDHAGDQGWLERARRDQFREHTGVAMDESIDDDEAARDAYNAWLARLDRS